MATIRLFVSNSMRGAMNELIPRFERATGHHVETSYDPAKVMMERIRRGESADLALLGGSSLDDLAREGRVDARTRRAVARCGVGVGARAGAAKPDIGSVDAFKRALLAARSVAWTQEGASGMYFSKLIERLGIAGELNAKAVRQRGGLVGELVAEGRAELAIQQIPELLAVPGVELVGPLPAEIQQTTASSIGLFDASREREAAAAFVDFLTSADSATVLRDQGHEPLVE